jgi:hypothetical protein
MKLITAAILAIAVTAPAQAQVKMPWDSMEAYIAPLYFSRGSGRICLMPTGRVPAPLPWWAKPLPDGQDVMVPLYICSPYWTGKNQFKSCASEHERCEYDFAISEVLARCRIGQDANDAHMRRCADLRTIVIRVNRTFCQTCEDICPRVD